MSICPHPLRKTFKIYSRVYRASVFLAFSLSLSLSFSLFLSLSKRRKAVSARVIFNYAVRLLEIVIAFETTRSTALLAETRRISWKVPKEESDSVGSSPGATSSSFVASKSRESYNEEIFASSAASA